MGLILGNLLTQVTTNSTKCDGQFFLKLAIRCPKSMLFLGEMLKVLEDETSFVFFPHDYKVFVLDIKTSGVGF